MTAFEQWAEPIVNELRPFPKDSDLPLSGRIEVFGDVPNSEAASGEAENSPELPDLSDEDDGILQGGLQESGVEVLAFYKSIRLRDRRPFRGRWGVFIFDFGIKKVSNVIALALPGVYLRSQSEEIARRYLTQHELFHFRFDAWALSQDALFHPQEPLYNRYLLNYYQRTRTGPEAFEEALANAAAWTKLRARGQAGWMEVFVADQPPGYRRYREPLVTLRKALAEAFFEDSFAAQGQPPFIAQGRPTYLADENCPVEIIRGVPVSRWLPSTLFLPTEDECGPFITRYLRGRRERQTDHELFRIDNNALVKKPNPHRGDRLKPWEFKSILQAAGMSSSEYRDERLRTGIWRKNVPRPTPKPSIM